MRTNLVHSLSFIRNHGMSLPEFYVLSTVGYDIVLTPDDLARSTHDEVKGDPRGEFAVEEYAAAIASCIDKQWLRVLSADDCLLDETRRTQETYPMCSVSRYMPGCVDFTDEGASHYYGLQKDLFKLFGYPSRRVGSNTDAPGRIDVYSDDEIVLKEYLRQIQQAPGDYAGEPATIVDVTPTTEIGPWWFNRFERVDQGLHAAVLYAAA
jgi:hypothetical protein